ncbi:hypothetical protein [Kitasatospora camelliae]|uniref:Uncharacterized protein n=1 Tax=Kitasatospora camelliae TaxID=3156397 RepID=A0AAU8K4G5_9ACTN
MSITRYYIESLAPTWLAADPGYRAALGEYLTACMDQNGWSIVDPPTVRPVEAAARMPVGMVLLQAECGVEEFDVDLDDDTTLNKGWLAAMADDGTAHVVPLDDVIEHDLDEDCPCGPAVRPEQRGDGSQGWVATHHSLDGREQREARGAAEE